MEHSLIKAAGESPALAVEAIHAFFRLLVDRWRSSDEGTLVTSPEILAELHDSGWLDIDDQAAFAISSEWREALEKSQPQRAEQELVFSRIWKRFLPLTVRDQDAKYFLTRSIRRRYGLKPSAQTARALHLTALALQQLLELYPDGAVPYERFLESAGASDGSTRPAHAAAYIELCWVLDHIRPAEQPGWIAVRPEVANAEYLASHLFGVPTGIPGFDDLFGGGGLMLADSFVQDQSIDADPSRDDGWTEPLIMPGPDFRILPQSSAAEDSVGGRVVLVIGSFGSGKSLLSLQMAVEVARKGGVAWVMALEQTDEECLYSLESIGVSTKDPSMRVYRGLTESFQAFFRISGAPAQGALVFLRPEHGDKPYFSEFLSQVQDQLKFMSRYPLRLLVIDPVNALGQPRAGDRRALRAKTRAMFEAAKKLNVNVWFTSEHLKNTPPPDRFEENVADTVIHLGVEDNQARRYVEITKSRFQQEFGGRHALVIEPETGIHVYPSASIFGRSLRSDVENHPPARISFGGPEMDRLLGPELLSPGDIVVLAGPGKAKTILGVEFLKADTGDKALRSLFVSDYSAQLSRYETAASFIERELPANQPDVLRCPIDPAAAEPSRVLFLIRTVLEKWVQKGTPIRRVLIDNLSRWEKEMPSIVRDAGFALALIRLLRSYAVVTVIVSGDELEHSGSALRETITSHSDVLIHSHRHDFKGRVTTLLTTVKSRRMGHPRESFELLVEHGRPRITPAPLLRMNAAGEVNPVRVVLYLHAETPNHQSYNRKTVAALRVTLSPATRIARQALRYDPQFLAMAKYSAVDELQIFQLDEYQLPDTGTGEDAPAVLHKFDCQRSQHLLEEWLPSLAKRVVCDQGRKFFAVPFYQNLSFLAYRGDQYKKEFGPKLPGNWDELAARCQEWERRYPLTRPQIVAARQTSPPVDGICPGEPADGPDAAPEVFFSCPVYEESVETYNCFFMELLYALVPPVYGEYCDLAHWLKREEAKVAAMQFRSLCRRSHLLGYASAKRPRGIFWRHWYNTLNQELSSMWPEERAQISVMPLFGNIATSGEWYLAIPAQSASPEIGLNLIQNLTTPEREMLRLQLGVGLPTRSNFYRESPGEADPVVAPYFRFNRQDLKKLMDGAIRRSRFRCYEAFSNAISAHLQWILEIPESEHVQHQVNQTLASLVSKVDFLRQSLQCNNCRSHTAPGWNPISLPNVDQS
jgi:KaiC/GvpD/RAD55 family RecA-like ATPase